MLFRKSLLAAAIVLPALSQADVYDARSFARGGTGLTMGEYNQALLNPALINKSDDNDDFSFAVNAGALASDPDGFVDAADEIRDDILALSGQGSARATEIDKRMQSYDGALAQVDGGVSVMIGIPNRSLPAALVVKGKVTLGVAYDYDKTGVDTQILQAIATNTPPSPVTDTNGDGIVDDKDLLSTATVSALGLAEAGLLFGHTFGGVETGVLVKAQQIELYEYSANVAEFDEDDAVDSKNKTSYSSLNLDVGANLRLGENGQFVLSGVIENLIPRSFDGPLSPAGTRAAYDMKPVAVAGAGYGNTWLKAEVNADLTARPGFDKIRETQFARAGIELSAGRHFHIRAGYRTDTKDNVPDLVTAGIGITPFDRFNIDLSAAKGKGETVGAALQIGFKI